MNVNRRYQQYRRTQDAVIRRRRKQVMPTRYFWNLVTGGLAVTADADTVAALLADGYVEIGKERHAEIAREVLTT